MMPLKVDSKRSLRKTGSSKKLSGRAKGYEGLVDGISALLEKSRHSSSRAVNAIMTATYWEVGRRIVEFDSSSTVKK